MRLYCWMLRNQKKKKKGTVISFLWTSVTNTVFSWNIHMLNDKEPYYQTWITSAIFFFHIWIAGVVSINQKLAAWSWLSETKTTWIKYPGISAGKNVTPGLMILLLIQWKVNRFVCRCFFFKINLAIT